MDENFGCSQQNSQIIDDQTWILGTTGTVLEFGVTIQVDAERYCEIFFKNNFLDKYNRTILAVVWKDDIVDKISYSVREINNFGYLTEYPEYVKPLQVSAEYYVQTLNMSQSYNLSILSYYNLDDAKNQFLDYQDTIDFRFIKIHGPNSLDLTECIKFTFQLKRSDVTKMNFYCYDPLRATYNCEQIRSDVPSSLFPSRNLQSEAIEAGYLDDRDKDPKRKCEDPGDKYICNT